MGYLREMKNLRVVLCNNEMVDLEWRRHCENEIHMNSNDFLYSKIDK